jgi:hypothetical protein
MKNDEDSRGTKTIFGNAIEKAVSDLFGEHVVPAFNQHLSCFYNITICDVFDNPTVLSEALYKNFQSVTPTIERAIAKRFYNYMGIQFTPVPGCTLAGYVEIAKRLIAGNQHN